MCGIAGFIAGQGAADAGALTPMLARIAHRGPDGQGTFVEGPAALGHCRLAIIDLAGGAQPLYSEDKNLVIVFNGEIYNYKALTAELTALGHRFATRTDTEVLLHGWEQWGRELLPRLRGMFAFALWDRRAGTLFCARDMFGIKPLYYCRCADGTLLFASEIKAFLDHPSFEKRLNAAQLPLYLSCQYSPGRDTFFAGVEKLLPGHFLIFSDGIVRTTRWVQPAKGYIRGYETLVDWEQAGVNLVEAVIELRVTPHKARGFDDIGMTIAQFDEVDTVLLMSGSYDLQVIIKGRSFQEIAIFVAKRLSPLDDVLSTATSFVLRPYKRGGRLYLPEEPDERECTVL